MPLSYQTEPDLSAEAFQRLLLSSGLAERRPADDLPRLDIMLRQAQLIVTARDDGQLVGLARSITDWAYCLYCSDLCVDRACQGRGIGKRLLEVTAENAPDVKTCLLLSAPAAVGFYDAAGYERHRDAFIFAKRP